MDSIRSGRASGAWVIFATLVGVYQVLVVGNIAAMAGFFMPQQIHRAIMLACVLTFVFLSVPMFGNTHGAGEAAPRAMPRGPLQWGLRTVDVLLLAGALTGLSYVIFRHEDVLEYSMMGFLDETGMLMALLICIPLIEAVRRTAGMTLVILVTFLVLMTIFQNYMPGILYGRGYSLDRLLYSALVGEAGIFGLPLGVASNIIFIFLLFGALMDRGGAGRWLLSLALALTGRSAGGPAKAAVVGSAFFGSISGSPSANVATTGVITIPLMKRVGYSPAFAGGVEAVASTGGQILPPVMGAIAFVMADWIGKPYGLVALSALAPALIYYLVVFVSVHLQARRAGVQALKASETPVLAKTLREGWFHLVPVIALIWFLIIEAYPPGMAGVLTLPFVIGVSFLAKDRSAWLTPGPIMQACLQAFRNWVTIVCITAFVGIMIGALELSGVGIKISTFILDLSGGNLVLTLILVGLASFFLGMGLDAIPLYVTLATLMAPALIQLGVSDIGAHLFVVYWGLASFITPPLCLAVFVAISLSGSKLWETGWEAVKLGIAVFVVPFAFTLNQGLLLMGAPATIAWAIATGFTGAVLLATGVQGWALGPMPWWGRAAAVCGGLLLIGPGYLTAISGGVLGLVAILSSRGKRAAAPAPKEMAERTP